MNPSDISKRIRKLSGRWTTYDLFRDWIEAMACAISNAVDRRPGVHGRREEAYMAIVKRYDGDASEVMRTFSEMLGVLTMLLEGEPDDVLGQLYMELGLSSQDVGQFFTPMSLCDMMATMTLGDSPVPPHGYFTVQEPAIGGGAQVIGMARAMLRRGLSPSHHLHVTGADIDRNVLLMGYVQLSLIGIPAVLYVGDTLRMEMREDWYTPAHVLGGWGVRLSLGKAVYDARLLLDAASAE